MSLTVDGAYVMYVKLCITHKQTHSILASDASFFSTIKAFL
jgi:hypothetical protein